MFKVHLVHISDKVLHEGDADYVALPGVMGDFEVYDKHMPVVSILGRGRVTIKVPNETKEEFKRILIEQGLMRFDGKELYAVVE